MNNPMLLLMAMALYLFVYIELFLLNELLRRCQWERMKDRIYELYKEAHDKPQTQETKATGKTPSSGEVDSAEVVD